MKRKLVGRNSRNPRHVLHSCVGSVGPISSRYKSDRATRHWTQNVSKHRFFNTNSIWINLDALSDTLKKHGGLLPLPMIRNAKTVNPRDSKSAKVYQLETAMGSAIECFDNAGAVVVPRSRFLPVKTCNDLLALRSDAYRLEEDATFTVSARGWVATFTLDLRSVGAHLHGVHVINRR